MVSEDGEIHVTHKTAYPYSEWKIEEIAEEVGLCFVEEVPFHKWDYEGYCNKKGSGNNRSKSFPVGECSTFKFMKKDPLATPQVYDTISSSSTSTPTYVKCLTDHKVSNLNIADDEIRVSQIS
ncbi:hypothetical protein QN277_018374 [Acacia crassicarpa]|uniref:25S rRNA (uridine-N(3))-methyltransferase BMT5-like domain-containing protein n=1 Tax=Acacia crassicarpa TaxID=499986 RepID=A0AAE1MRG3_9FABA|nr:hypothetical protein QN277_018374 [Acacia crassicarpa]